LSRFLCCRFWTLVSLHVVLIEFPFPPSARPRAPLRPLPLHPSAPFIDSLSAPNRNVSFPFCSLGDIAFTVSCLEAVVISRYSCSNFLLSIPPFFRITSGNSRPFSACIAISSSSCVPLIGSLWQLACPVNCGSHVYIHGSPQLMLASLRA